MKIPKDPRFCDITGFVFGKWKVIKYAGKTDSGYHKWSCKCSCGTTKTIGCLGLKNGSSKSCGCARRNRFINKIGLKFNRLLVLEEGPHAHNRVAWICLCDCGNITLVSSSNLKKTKSCGCAASEATTKRNKSNATHGMSHTVEHAAWQRMINRCYYKNDASYNHYGGRGISVCDKWINSFESFFRDMGLRPSPKHSLDRINTNGNYTSENCKWSTIDEQNNNKTNNRFITAFGKHMTISQWSRETGIHIATITGRLNRGWNEQDAISKQVQCHHLPSPTKKQHHFPHV